MKLSRIISLARRALQTEKGRAVGRRAVDVAADAGRRVSRGKYDSTIDKVQRAARKYLGDTGGQPPGPR